jgi:hypothetical protein
MRDPGSVTYSAAIESAATTDTNPTEPLNRFSARPAKASNRPPTRCTELDDGKLHAVAHFLNRARMRYPKFHAQSPCTSTGGLEAGLQIVAIGTRLGANAIIAPRCCRLRGRFEDFWERRPP